MIDTTRIAIDRARRAALEHFVQGVIRDVADLPDRTSPDEQPEMMLVSGAELEALLHNRLADQAPALGVALLGPAEPLPPLRCLRCGTVDAFGPAESRTNPRTDRWTMAKALNPNAE